MEKKSFNLLSYLCPVEEARERSEAAESMLVEDVKSLSALIRARAGVNVREIQISNPKKGLLELLTDGGYKIDEVNTVHGGNFYKISW